MSHTFVATARIVARAAPLLAALLLAATSACAGSSAGGATNSTQALCRFSSPTLTTGAQARQMAAEIQAVIEDAWLQGISGTKDPQTALNDASTKLQGMLT